MGLHPPIEQRRSGVFRLLRPFEYLEPASVSEAVEMLTRHGERARIFAGGTDLVISMKKRQIVPDYLIAISHLSELDFLEAEPDGTLRMGPLVTHARIAASPLVRQRFPMLATACNEVGTPQVRNMGTIGGNLCKAGPSQDTPPVLVALEAKLHLVGPRGMRTVPMDQFCTGPFCTVLAQDELVVEIEIPPLPPRGAGCYKWITKITATDETLAGAGVVVVLKEDGSFEDVRIGLGSVAPMAIRARKAEALLRGTRPEAARIAEAAQIASEEAEPRSRAAYRRHMVKVLVNEGVTEMHRQIAASMQEAAQ